MDRLTRLRGPLAVTALVALTLVAAARVGLGLSEVGAGGSTAVAAARLAPNGGDGALTVLAGVLVTACFLPSPVPGRRRLAAWGAVLAAVSLVATVVALALTSVEVAGWSLVWLVPDVVVPAVVGLGLLALARPSAAAVPRASAADERPDDVVGEAEEVEPEPGPDPELQPGWTQDAAAGAVWRTAGEAARGAPASGWGRGDAWGDDASSAGWVTTGSGAPDALPTSGGAAAWGRPPALSGPGGDEGDEPAPPRGASRDDGPRNG